jgi:hypothetical protein
MTIDLRDSGAASFVEAALRHHLLSFPIPQLSFLGAQHLSRPCRDAAP